MVRGIQSPGTADCGSLATRLAQLRRDHFVGRDEEVELLHDALDRGTAPFAALHVHGPGGIGKSTLLTRYEAVARDAGCHVARLDGRDLEPSPAGLRRALDDQLPGDGCRLVLLVDGHEHLAGLDDWFRTTLLPELPSDAIAVLASRHPPAAAWRTDPAWRALLRVVPLGDLDRDACIAYLEHAGVPTHLRARVAEISHGHPLGLSLLADVANRTGAVEADPLTPDLVGTLLGQFVDSVLDPPRRRTLEVCALARVTTESLLRDTLDADPHDSFAWLRGLSFVEETADGVAPHELARAALHADLRWRDPTTYEDVFRAVRDHVTTRIAEARGGHLHRAILDLKFLFRHIPADESPVDWDAWGRHRPEPATADDRAGVLALIEHHEGPEARDLAAHWWDVQPDAFFVIRDSAGIAGVLGLLDLTRASDAERAVDPGAAAAWAHAQRHAPPRPGERVTQTRFVVDGEAHQDPSPTLNVVPIITLERYLAMPALAWDYLTLESPDRWDDYFAMADLPRAPEADFTVGGRTSGLFCHDFRVTPVDSLIRLWTERALARDGDAGEEPDASTDVTVLAHTDFRDAVRQALRDINRPDLLRRNPLCGTRAARLRCAEGRPGAETVDLLLREGIARLERDSRDHKRLRAVERTYLHDAPNQEAAAEVLGLPFSTYRRHLTQGVDRIVEHLWELEVHGTGGSGEHE